MANETQFVTIKFGGGGKNYINHVFLGSNPSEAEVSAFFLDLENLTKNAEGDTVVATGGRVVSMTKPLQRILANQDVLEISDLETVNPHIITGRLLLLDTNPVPPKTFTQPFILKGVNPQATQPPGFASGAGQNYITWLKEFLIKYGRVKNVAPTGVTIVKDVLMH